MCDVCEGVVGDGYGCCCFCINYFIDVVFLDGIILSVESCEEVFIVIMDWVEVNFDVIECLVIVFLIIVILCNGEICEVELME